MEVKLNKIDKPITITRCKYVMEFTVRQMYNALKLNITILIINEQIIKFCRSK